MTLKSGSDTCHLNGEKNDNRTQVSCRLFCLNITAAVKLRVASTHSTTIEDNDSDNVLYTIARHDNNAIMFSNVQP